MKGMRMRMSWTLSGNGRPDIEKAPLAWSGLAREAAEPQGAYFRVHIESRRRGIGEVVIRRQHLVLLAKAGSRRRTGKGRSVLQRE